MQKSNSFSTPVNTKGLVRYSIQAFLIRWLSIGLAVFLLVNLTSCSSTRGLNTNELQSKKIDFLAGTDPFKASTFYKLRMTKVQFDRLRSYRGKRMIVQFFYPEASKGGSPTLFVYKMTVNHKPTKSSPVILSYDASTNEPLEERGQVLGDQKVRMKDLKGLIKRVKGDKKAAFSYLLFTPRFLPDNPHMTYDVSVEGSDEFITLNPSPPG